MTPGTIITWSSSTSLDAFTGKQQKYEDIIHRVFDLMQERHKAEFSDVKGYYDTPRQSYKEFPICTMALEEDFVKDVGVRQQDHNATFKLHVFIQSFQRDNNAEFLYAMSRKLKAMFNQNPHLSQAPTDTEGIVRRAWVTSVRMDFLRAFGLDDMTVTVQATWKENLPLI